MFIQTGFEHVQSHDAILQVLNRKITNRDGTFYFPLAPFRQTVDEWEGIPIIYAQKHPEDYEVFTTSPEIALKQIDGRVVGSISLPHIDNTGHPRLMGKLDIDDVLINTLIEEGEISLSTGFFGHFDNNKNVTSVSPHHVLIFLEELTPPADQGAMILNAKKEPYGNVEYADPGYQKDKQKRYPIDTEEHVRAAWSYINMPKNQKMYTTGQIEKIKVRIKAAAKKFGIEIKNTGDTMADKFTKEDMDTMLDFMKENPGMMDKSTMDKMYSAMDKANQKEYMKSMLKDLQSHPEMMDDEMKSMMTGMKKETKNTMGNEDELANQLQISNTKIETMTSELEDTKTQLGNAMAQLKVFEQRETDRLKVTREEQWQKIKKGIPIGLTHKAEDETKLRSEFESDPYAFAAKLTEFNQTAGTQEEGTEFQNANLTDEQKEAKADAQAAEELREIGGMNKPRRR